MAITVALLICVGVYVVGGLLLLMATEFLHFSGDVASMIGMVLLFVSLMAAVVVMLRDKSRRI